jgi:DNA repair exonuclease SbcCD ATPase subunit
VNEETTVTVHGSSNAVRDRIQNRINSAFLERGIMGKAQGKPDTDLIEEAEALGVEVGFLRLVYRALEADDTLSFEDALLMTQEALIAIIRDNAPNVNMVMNAMKTEFFEDRQALFDVYIPQIQALEAQIALLEEAEEDSTDLRAELDALKQEFHEALAQLRSAYQADKEAQRAMFLLQRQERINTHQNEVAAFRNAMRTRRMQMKSAIEAFQRGTRTTLQSGNQGS